MLEAQIEPHFLFNSLANVRRLLRIDGEAGRAMLADLMRYLESALPRMRADSSTLARALTLRSCTFACASFFLAIAFALRFIASDLLDMVWLPR